MYRYNTDVKARDTIIFGGYKPDMYTGGIRHFKGMTGEILRYLIDNNFTSLNICQNYSPTIGDFLVFLEKHPDYTAHGYVVSVDRVDFRVSLEGLSKEVAETDIDTLKEFVILNRFADDFEICNMMYSWFD